MKYFAASVPRSVRAARLAHLPLNMIIGSKFFDNPGGARQVFDIVMQPEADFIRTRNLLAAPPMGAALTQGGPAAPYMLRDIQQCEIQDGTENPATQAAAHFRTIFKIEG